MSNTKTDAEKSLFVYVKDTNTNVIKRMAIPCDVQIGLVGIPSELQLNGRLSLSTLEYVVKGVNGTLNVSSDTTVINVNVSSAPTSNRITINLPTRPRDGEIHIIKDSSGTAGTTPIDIITPTGILIDGSTSKTLSTAYDSAVIYWMKNAWYNLIVSSGGGGSYTAPTGTGIPHIAGGVQQAAASLIVNADVDAAAAIAASKVVQATGTGIPHVSGGALVAASSLIVNADVDAAAAIAVSKLASGTNSYILTTVAGVATWAANAVGLPVGCSTIAATQNVSTVGLTSDLTLTANAFITLVRFTDGGTPSLDGIVSDNGAFRIVILLSPGGGLNITDYSTSLSAAANQFGSNVYLTATVHGAAFAYDPTSQRWINLGHTW